MSEVKWIKITIDIFNDEKMQLIESMPDSDSIIVIWFKLLSLAGKSNTGGLIMMSDKVPYTKEMLPILFRRKPTVVELALHTFVQFGMIEILDNDTILISNWEKHQNKKGLDSIKEQNKIRQQRFRDNKKKLLLEQEQELDIDIEGNATNNVTIPYKAIVDVLNKKIGSRFSFNTTDTRTKIKARWNERLKDKKSPDIIFKEFILCINNAYEYWKKKNDFNFMRPKTLFNGDMENRVNGNSYGWEERSIGKNLLPQDIEVDWLDDYIKERDSGIRKISMGEKDRYCKAHGLNINKCPSDDIILKWLR